MRLEQASLDKSREKQASEEAKQRSNRSYKTSLLPVFKDGAQEPEKRALLLALYGEVCSSWRMQTDVRFKLLGLVPAVSVLAWIGLLFIARLANR